jgi:hypothetical protein
MASSGWHKSRQDKRIGGPHQIDKRDAACGDIGCGRYRTRFGRYGQAGFDDSAGLGSIVRPAKLRPHETEDPAWLAPSHPLHQGRCGWHFV